MAAGFFMAAAPVDKPAPRPYNQGILPNHGKEGTCRMPKQAFLEAGQIVGTHGVRGEVRVQPWCDSPALFATLTTLYWDKAGASPVRVKSRPHKNIALAKLDGVDTVQDASALRGKLLYLARADLKLPADRYFIKDLIGMTIVDADSGHPYGALTAVSETGANPVYHMTMENGREILIPAIPSVIVEVNLDTDVIRMRPLEGLFDA